MAKANIETSNGTKIDIEGEPEEINKIIRSLNNDSYSKKRDKRITKKSKMGVTDYLRELKEEEFFDKPKDLQEIKDELDGKGHIYPLNEISTPIVRLVRKRELGRMKKNNKWVYVRR